MNRAHVARRVLATQQTILDVQFYDCGRGNRELFFELLDTRAHLPYGREERIGDN